MDVGPVQLFPEVTYGSGSWLSSRLPIEREPMGPSFLSDPDRADVPELAGRAQPLL